MVAPPLVFPRAWWPVFLWKLKSMEKNLCNTFLGKPTKVNARVASPSRDSVLPLFEEIEQELLETFSPDLDLFWKAVFIDEHWNTYELWRSGGIFLSSNVLSLNPGDVRWAVLPLLLLDSLLLLLWVSFLYFWSKLLPPPESTMKFSPFLLNSGSSLEYGSIMSECSLPSWTYFSKISLLSTDDARLLWRLIKIHTACDIMVKSIIFGI